MAAPTITQKAERCTRRFFLGAVDQKRGIIADGLQRHMGQSAAVRRGGIAQDHGFILPQDLRRLR